MESTKRKLFDKLRAFYNDRDFVLGVMSIVDTPENYQKIIDFMDKEEDVSASQITAYAVLLDDATEKPRPI